MVKKKNSQLTTQICSVTRYMSRLVVVCLFVLCGHRKEKKRMKHLAEFELRMEEHIILT